MQNKVKTIFSLVVLSGFFTALSFAEGEVEGFREHEFWEDGKIKECRLLDVQGHLKTKMFYRQTGSIERIEKYDINGNRTELSLYDENGSLNAGIDGWAAMRWWYDGLRLRSQISYDEQGLPIERKQYSEGGRLVLRQFRDDIKEAPYEEASMFMMLGNQNVPYRLKKTALKE